MQVIQKTDKAILRQIESFDESMTYGRGAGWCTAPNSGGRSYYNNYRLIGDLFIISESRRPKFQIHKPFPNVMRPIEIKGRGNKGVITNELYDRYPEFGDFFLTTLGLQKFTLHRGTVYVDPATEPDRTAVRYENVPTGENVNGFNISAQADDLSRRYIITVHHVASNSYWYFNVDQHTLERGGDAYIAQVKNDIRQFMRRMLVPDDMPLIAENHPYV